MRIPLLLVRGRAQRAPSADLPIRTKHLLRFLPSPKFRNPLPHPARVAMLSQRCSGRNLRLFQPSESTAIGAFRPEILAAPLSALRELSGSVSVSKAIVVFTDRCSSPLTQASRDWLWQRFAVPCFEQLLDATGHVIAEECQVHDGLHVLRLEATSGTLTTAECDCGRTEPRLK
jgi:hypothetical protein